VSGVPAAPIRPAIVALLAAGALASGCSGDTPATPPEPAASTSAPPDRPAAPPRPALCAATTGVITGRVRSGAATELSGLVFGRAAPGVLWTHNDSGDVPRLLAVRTSGLVLGVPTVTGAAATDWEDIAAGPGPGGSAPLLYVGDIGDNAERRASIDVFRVPEPAPDATATAPAARLRLRYPDGAHDAEALLVDPRRPELLIVTKGITGGRVYRARSDRPAGSLTTLRAGPAVPLALVTGGDVSADGRTVVLRTYTGLTVWTRRGAEPLTRTLRRPASCTITGLLREGQGEAVALTPGGSAAYTVVEGERPAIRRYGGR
jgi:hypothetical protein